MASPLAPLLTTPVKNGHVSNTGNVTFYWTYRHPEPGKTQAKISLRRRVPGGAYEYWNGAIWTTANYFVTTTAYYAMAVSNFTTGTAYLWSVSVQDNAAANSPYSDEQMFKAVAIPTLTVYSANTNTSFPRISWEYVSATGMAQQRYRVAVYTAAQYGIGGFTPFTSPSTWESGWVESDQTYYTDMTTEVANGVTYKAYVQCETFTGLQSAATASSTFIPALTLPSAPTGTLTGYSSLGYVKLALASAFNLLSTDEASFAAGIGGWTGHADVSLTWTTFGGYNVMQMTCAGAVYGYWSTNVLYDTYTEIAAAALTNTNTKTSQFLSEATKMRAITPIGTSGKVAAAGQKYSGAFRCQRASGTSNVTAMIYWYNAAGALISSSSGTPTSVTTGAWTDVKIENITAPALTAFAALAVDVVIAAVGEILYVKDAVLANSVTATYSTGGFGANASFVIERYNEYTSEWEGIPGYSRDFPGVSHFDSYAYVDAIDTAVPQGSSLPILYRTYSVSTDGSGLVSILSAVSNFSYTDKLPGSGFWLRDPLDPTRDEMLQQMSFAPRYSIDAELHKPVGRDKPVMVYLNTPVYNEFQIATWVHTEADLKQLFLLLNSGRTLIVQTMNALVYWVRIAGGVNVEQVMAKGNGTDYVHKHLFKVTATAIEVKQLGVKYTVALGVKTWAAI